MTTTQLLENLRTEIDRLALNERALKTLSKIKTIDSDVDLFPEFLKGFSRNEIVFKPKEQHLELYNFTGFDPSVITIIGIYIKDVKGHWVDDLKPIGFFEYQTTIEGEYLNDHIEITENKYSS